MFPQEQAFSPNKVDQTAFNHLTVDIVRSFLRLMKGSHYTNFVVGSGQDGPTNFLNTSGIAPGNFPRKFRQILNTINTEDEYKAFMLPFMELYNKSIVLSVYQSDSAHRYAGANTYLLKDLLSKNTTDKDFETQAKIETTSKLINYFKEKAEDPAWKNKFPNCVEKTNEIIERFKTLGKSPQKSMKLSTVLPSFKDNQFDNPVFLENTLTLIEQQLSVVEDHFKKEPPVSA